MNGGAEGGTWEDHAAWWQAEFTAGADPEYTEQILPLIAAHLPEGGRMLDVGAGEGQVARLGVAAGLDVVALDPAWAQVAEGQHRGGGVRWVRGSATELPVATASMDVVVACLVVEHVADLDAAIGEVARVLRPGGRFLFLLNHPLLQTPDSGWIDDQVLDPPEQYWRIGPYLPEVATLEQVERDVFIEFFHRPLHRYLNRAFEVGLSLDRIEEPAPPPGFVERAVEYAQAATIPRLLFLRFRRDA